MKNLLVILLLLTFCNVVYPQDGYDKDLLKYGIEFIPLNSWVKYSHKNIDTKAISFFYFPDKESNITIISPIEMTSEHFDESMAIYRRDSLFEEKMVMFNVPCFVFITFPKGEDGIAWKRKIINFYKNGKIYLIGLQAVKSEFDNHLPLFKQVLDNLSVK